MYITFYTNNDNLSENKIVLLLVFNIKYKYWYLI